MERIFFLWKFLFRGKVLFRIKFLFQIQNTLFNGQTTLLSWIQKFTWCLWAECFRHFWFFCRFFCLTKNAANIWTFRWWIFVQLVLFFRFLLLTFRFTRVCAFRIWFFSNLVFVFVRFFQFFLLRRFSFRFLVKKKILLFLK